MIVKPTNKQIHTSLFHMHKYVCKNIEIENNV